MVDVRPGREGEPSPRAAALKERLLKSPYEIDIERARFYTCAWKREEAAGPFERASRALEETLRNMTIRIDDDELLVGVKTAKRLATLIPVERGDFNTVLDLELDRLVSRADHRFLITDEERSELEREILPYWRGRTVRDRKIELWREHGIYEPMRFGPVGLARIVRGAGLRRTAGAFYLTLGHSLKAVPKLHRMQRELAGLRPNLALTVFDVQGHFVPGYRSVLELGFSGIADRARILAKGSDPIAKAFLDAVVIAAEAACAYSQRYVDLALEKAETAGEPRRSELLAVAERCRRVPALPPRTFMEALQSLWMAQVVLSISYGMAGVLSPGRIDTYLQPYYPADLESGLIARGEALEALEEYFVKLGGELIMLIESGKETASEMGVGSNTVTIGGLRQDGSSAVDEVSYLVMEAHDNVKALANNLSVRIGAGTPREFLERACGSYRHTSGLAFFNDRVIPGELERDGFSRRDAFDYSIVGCVEPTSTGSSFACTAGNDISLAGVLEMALNRGHMLFAGRRVGAPTPDPRGFTGFEQVVGAFRTQLGFNVDRIVEAVELLDQAYAEGFPSPLLSATLEGCIESGRDMTAGGALYEYGSITARGLGTVANSLAAVRYAVFEEGFVSMEELVQLLRHNFRGGEALRARLLSEAPKYGNDDESADGLAQLVTDLFCGEVRSHPCSRGGFYRPGMFSYGVHVIDGLFLGATPDGRLAGEPVSNGISPVNGSERLGPTAVLRSASRAQGSLTSNGTSLNMRLDPALLSTPEKVSKLASMVAGYFELGGRHVQFNVVDTATLRDAQAHPERYPDLVVRVSGYCAYFTDLGRSIQDDIIERTCFGDI